MLRTHQTSLCALVQEAHDRLREYEGQRAHGLTQNQAHLDDCVSRAERLIVQALVLLDGGGLASAQGRDELAHRVARTAVALLQHDHSCRDFACLMRDGCPERQALMEAHNEATNDYEEVEV